MKLENNCLYLVRWRMTSTRFIGGIAYSRYKGDEDILHTVEARTHMQSKQVDILRKIENNKGKEDDT
jgi:hypothetical protein